MSEHTPTPKKKILKKHKDWALLQVSEGGATKLFSKGDRIVVDGYYFVVEDVSWFQVTVIPYGYRHAIADGLKRIWNDGICWWNFA